MNRKLTYLFFCALFFACNLLYAHETNVVHPKVTELAKDEITSKGDTKSPYKEVNDYSDKLRQGSIEEDSFPRYANHFYDPMTSYGLIGRYTSAMDYGEGLWKNALNYYGYSNAEKEKAYKTLGLAAHVLEDMSSPPHVSSDPHVSIFGIGQEYDYEQEEVRYAGYFQGASGIKPVLSYRSAIQDLSVSTYMSVLVRGNLNLDTNNPAEGDIAKLFDISLESGFKHVNGTIMPVKYWLIKDVGTIGLDDEGDGIWKVGYLNAFYVEKVKYVIPKNYWSNGQWVPNAELFSLAKLWAGTIDTIGKYASPNQMIKLIPETISYIAGLLKRYSDLVNLPPYVKSVTVTAGGKTIYSARWEDVLKDGRVTKRKLMPEKFKKRATGVLGKKVQAEIEIVFGGDDEVIDPSSVKVMLGKKRISGSLTQENIWKGSFNLANAGKVSGNLGLSIEARDVHKHAKISGALDSYPATAAYYNASGSWTGYSGRADCNHVIRADTVPPEILLGAPKGTVSGSVKVSVSVSDSNIEQGGTSAVENGNTIALKPPKPSQTVLLEDYEPPKSPLTGDRKVQSPGKHKVTVLAK